jgi:hypothetical protein
MEGAALQTSRAFRPKMGASRPLSRAYSPWLAEPLPAAAMRVRRLGTGASGETLPGFLYAVSFASRTAGTGTHSH